MGCWANYFIKIPYAPFPGLVIHSGKGEIFELKKILYDHSTKVTTCSIEPEYHEDYNFAKEHALEWGWKLREVPSGNKCEDPDTMI